MRPADPNAQANTHAQAHACFDRASRPGRLLLGTLLATALLGGAVKIAHADGPGAYRPRSSSQQPVSHLRAIDAYNAGYAAIQRADHADSLAAAAVAGAQREAARREARLAYEESLQRLAEAVELDPGMHEGYTYMGYARRKLGQHEQALQAYAQALRIDPQYTYAIEYQGEVWLDLGRPEQAQRNYLRLYALDKRQASKLFLAMRAWLQVHRAAAPDGVDMEALAAWIAERAASSEKDAARNAAGSW